MSFLEGQAPVPPEDEGARKVFYVNASPIEGPLDVVRAEGLPSLYEKWKPFDPRFPTIDVVQPQCHCIESTRIDETHWEVVAHYAYA